MHSGKITKPKMGTEHQQRAPCSNRDANTLSRAARQSVRRVLGVLGSEDVEVTVTQMQQTALGQNTSTPCSLSLVSGTGLWQVPSETVIYGLSGPCMELRCTGHPEPPVTQP